MRNADQELGVKNRVITTGDVADSHRVHMVNDNAVEDWRFESGQVATFVSNNDFVSKTLPFERAVELLV